MLVRLNELTATYEPEKLEKLLTYGGRTFVKPRMWEQPRDERDVDWDGAPMWETTMGPKTQQQAEEMVTSFQRDYVDVIDSAHPVVEREPQWTVEQCVHFLPCTIPLVMLTTIRIEGIEEQLGAGLIEEVVQVAEGELKLLDTMIEHKV